MMLGRIALLGLLSALTAGCSNKGEAAPAPTNQPAERAVVRPTVEPIRAAATATEVATATEELGEMPAETIVRERAQRLAAAPSATPPAVAAPPSRPAAAADNDDDDDSDDDDASDLILSDQLFGDSSVATAKPEPAPEPAAAPAPVVVPEPAPAPAAPAASADSTAAPARAPVKSTVSLGSANAYTDTSLSPASVRSKVQRSYLDQVRGCHEDYLLDNPGKGGNIVLQITVGPDGRVSVARTSGFGASLQACLKDAALGWKFSAPTDQSGKPVAAPFKLQLWLRAG